MLVARSNRLRLKGVVSTFIRLGAGQVDRRSYEEANDPAYQLLILLIPNGRCHKQQYKETCWNSKDALVQGGV